jgi:lipopolysaccharide export system permease protein
MEDDKLVSKLSAESAKWDSTTSSWRLKNWFIREYGDGLQDKVTTGKQLDTVISLTVEDFYRTRKTVEQLSYDDLDALIETQKSRGDANVMYALIEKNNRFSLPFSAFILTIMGVSLSTKKRRGGIGWNIAIGIALSFSYILFMKFSEMFVYTDTLPPGIAIWLPNLLFAVVAAVMYIIAPK